MKQYFRFVREHGSKSSKQLEKGNYFAFIFSQKLNTIQINISLKFFFYFVITEKASHLKIHNLTVDGSYIYYSTEKVLFRFK